MHLPSSQQMQVKVIDGLSAVRAGVHHCAETVDEKLLVCNFVHCEQELSEQLGLGGGGLSKRSEVSLGDDQDMHRRLRMDVGKREHGFIFVETRDRDCAAGDLAKETVRSCSHVRMLNLRGYFLKYLGSIPGSQGLYALPKAARRPMAGWL
jgi:hypothetical protein